MIVPWTFSVSYFYSRLFCFLLNNINYLPCLIWPCDGAVGQSTCKSWVRSYGSWGCQYLALLKQTHQPTRMDPHPRPHHREQASPPELTPLPWELIPRSSMRSPRWWPNTTQTKAVNWASTNLRLLPEVLCRILPRSPFSFPSELLKTAWKRSRGPGP